MGLAERRHLAALDVKAWHCHTPIMLAAFSENLHHAALSAFLTVVVPCRLAFLEFGARYHRAEAMRTAIMADNAHHVVRRMLLAEFMVLLPSELNLADALKFLVVAERRCLCAVLAKHLGQPETGGQQGQARLGRPLHTCCWWNQALNRNLKVLPAVNRSLRVYRGKYSPTNCSARQTQGGIQE